MPKQLNATTQATIDERDRLAAITQKGAGVKKELTKEELVESANSSFRAEKVVGYAESSGDTFTIHAERASDMRFHMMLADKQGLESYRTAGINTLVYTNDAEQRYVYDVVAGHVVTPRVPTQRETYCRQHPRGSLSEDDGTLEYCDVRDDPANQVSAAKPVPSATTATNAAKHLGTAGSPRTVTKAVDTPKPCFTDTLGHTVCLAAATPVATVTTTKPLVNTGSSDTVTKTLTSNNPQSAPAALVPATTTVIADTPKPCFTDKSDHTVCLAQHQ